MIMLMSQLQLMLTFSILNQKFNNKQQKKALRPSDVVYDAKLEQDLAVLFDSLFPAGK